MSIVSSAAIEAVAQSLGMEEIHPDIPKQLAPDVEYRLREITQEALKFMRHGKRDTLTVEDINNALRVRNMEPTLGIDGGVAPKFVKAAEGLYFLEDEEVDLLDAISAPFPPIPREPRFVAHWLAVEGTQPKIPQNPGPLPQSHQPTETSATQAAQPVATAPSTRVVPLVKLKKTILSPVAEEDSGLLLEAALRRNSVLNAALDTLSKNSGAEMGVETYLNTAGLQQLLPYFTQFSSDEVTRNLSNLPILYSLMRCIRAILVNPNIHVDPYLHHFIPSIMTCLVAKKIGDGNEHWTVRDYCASTLTIICRKFGDTYTTLQPRIVKTLVRALLDPARPTTTHYGALVVRRMRLIG